MVAAVVMSAAMVVSAMVVAAPMAMMPMTVASVMVPIAVPIIARAVMVMAMAAGPHSPHAGNPYVPAPPVPVITHFDDIGLADGLAERHNCRSGRRGRRRDGAPGKAHASDRRYDEKMRYAQLISSICTVCAVLSQAWHRDVCEYTMGWVKRRFPPFTHLLPGSLDEEPPCRSFASIS